MKPGAMLVNTSRGALIDTPAVIEALKTGHLGDLGHRRLRGGSRPVLRGPVRRVLQDDIFARLLTFPNVLVTGHQAFFTDVALGDIARTTLANVTAFARGEPFASVRE